MNTLLITNYQSYDAAKKFICSRRDLSEVFYLPYDFFGFQRRDIELLPLDRRKLELLNWEKEKLSQTRRMVRWDQIDQFIFFYPYGCDLTDFDIVEIKAVLNTNKPFFNLFAREEIFQLIRTTEEPKQKRK